jgi:hypothetical protein
MFQIVTESVLVAAPIESRIQSSDLSPTEKQQFLNLLSYFTPGELEELGGIL